MTAWEVMMGDEDDRDYFVLTNDNRTDSLIAEIPDSPCSKLSHFPALREKYGDEKYGDARDFVNGHIETPGSSVEVLATPVKVKVTGFCFLINGACEKWDRDTSYHKDQFGELKFTFWSLFGSGLFSKF